MEAYETNVKCPKFLIIQGGTTKTTKNMVASKDDLVIAFSNGLSPVTAVDITWEDKTPITII